MTHSLNQDSQSSSTGSGICLFAGCCGVGFAAGGVAGAAWAVTVGLGAGSA